MTCRQFAGTWTAAEANTTGALTAYAVLAPVQQFTFGFETGPGCTCTVQMQAAPASSGPWASLIVAANLSTSAYQVQQMAGPLAWLRPYITAKTTGVLIITAEGV